MLLSFDLESITTAITEFFADFDFETILNDIIAAITGFFEDLGL